MSKPKQRSGGTSRWRRGWLLLFGLLLSGQLGCATLDCVGELPPRPVPSHEATMQMLEMAPQNVELWEYMAELDRYLDAIGAPL